MDTGDKFREFIRSFAAAVELEARAAKQGSFIEVVVLSAAVIDGMLRIGVILKHQLDTRTNELVPELLHQGESDAAITERTVYRRARDASVITPGLHDELHGLYDERNRVVHRYVISAITTQDVLDIALRYETAEQNVSDAIAFLEEEQIRLGVGMTVRGGAPDVTDLPQFTAAKHGPAGLAKALRRGG